jgi:hypothetical protein
MASFVEILGDRNSNKKKTKCEKDVNLSIK